MSQEKDTIIVDLDGTLADCNHRIHLAQAKEWDQFNGLCSKDPVHQDVAEAIWALGHYYHIILLTGRSEKWRHMTIEWLIDNELQFFDELRMRPEGDWRSDFDVKLSLIEDVKDRILFALDDRDKVVEAFRNAGIPCWQTRNGTY